MAWRPGRYLIDGELDNTRPGSIAGWLRFAGLPHRVSIELSGDFAGSLKGSRIHVSGCKRASTQAAIRYMRSFSLSQTGTGGDILIDGNSSGQSVLYIEWYSDQDGRVVLELAGTSVQVLD